MQADVTLDYGMLTVEREHRLYMMARFIATGSPSQRPRRPLNLSLVLDRSGSMAGDKLDYTRQACQFVVQHLSSSDLCSIVLYNDKVETLFPPQHVVNRDALSQQIETIKPRGTTNLSGGWLEGCHHIRAHLAPRFLNRVILLTDGLANRGVTDRAQLVALAQQLHGEGISTTTMGLGMDFHEDLLIDIASAGGGAFYFIESPEVAPTIFQEELSGLLSLAVQNLTATLSVDSAVKSFRQLNAYPFDGYERRCTYRLGDLYDDETKTLVLELYVPSLQMLGMAEIAALDIAYDEMTPNGIVRQSRRLPVTVNGAAASRPTPDEGVAEAVLLLQAANARQQAVQQADAGHFAEASQILRTVAGAIERSPVQNNQLRDERQALITQAEALQQGAGAFNEYSRKVLSTQAYYTMSSRHEETRMLRVRELERGSQLPSKPQPLMTSALTYPPTRLRPPDAVTLLPPRTVVRGAAPTTLEWRGQEFPLTGDIIRIGRAVHNEIVIEESGVSRFHSQIRRDGDSLWIEDLGSTNGTLVGGQRLTGPYRLSVGDVVYLCDEKLTFR